MGPYLMGILIHGRRLFEEPTERGTLECGRDVGCQLGPDPLACCWTIKKGRTSFTLVFTDWRAIGMAELYGLEKGIRNAHNQPPLIKIIKLEGGNCRSFTIIWLEFVKELVVKLLKKSIF